MNTKKPRKPSNTDGVNLAREFMRTELVGEYTLTDSAGNYLAPTDIVALWDDSTIAKKFDIATSSALNLRRELNIPNVFERRKTVFAKLLRQSPNGENRQVVQKSPVATKEPKNTLPSWCKPGQWVMTPDGSVAQISVIGTLSATVQFRDCSIELQIDDLKPVKFRQYSYGEAKGLIGKVMECSYDEGPFSGRTEKSQLITTVSKSKYGVLINGDFFIDLSERFNATIDGLPIGIPVIDEEGGAE